MPTEVVLFWLISGDGDGAREALKKATVWKDALLSWTLREEARPRGVAEPLVIRDAREREDAPWAGRPFILIGRSAEIKSYLSRLPPEAARVIDDCAYYWILTDADQESLEVPLDIEDRTVVLNWDHENYNVIRSQLAGLQESPQLVGLSRGLSFIRSEIKRLAVGRKGPWTPTLILGESGTGKEEVAGTLYAMIDHEESGKIKDKFTSIACGWFTAELLQDQLFGHVRGAFTYAIKNKPGILEEYSDAAILLNDFETAPPNIQGALLGVLATPKGQPAKITRLGDDVPHETKAWLMFSTNADIDVLINRNQLREDFIFRLGDRIIHIPPLRERPADIPALAHHIWDELWEEQEALKRPLSAAVLQWLLARQTRWEGNVRALQALLSFAASMARLPAHRHQSLRRILEVIMTKGPEYRHWVGIVATRTFNRPIPPGDLLVREVLDLDHDSPPESLTRSGQPWPTTGSEQDAAGRLSEEGKTRFTEKVLAGVKPSRGKARASVRLSRAICYVARGGKIDKHIYMALAGVEETTAVGELKRLEKAGLLNAKSGRDTSQQSKARRVQATVYEPVGGMFRP
jgi:DNA-binding NtrC family response regulator